jgi:type I restriction enzyme S subunit
VSWKTVAIGDVCSIVNGGTPKSEVLEYWDGDLNWITPKEMGKLASREISSTERKITEKGMKNSSAKLLPINSVILSSRAPIGHLAINKSLMATNQGCKGLVPSESLNFEYLYYFLSYSKQILNDLGSGATFKELSGSKLATVQIPLPSLPTQKKIVAKLEVIFAEIEKAITAAEANAKNAESLFQSYLSELFEHGGEDWCELRIKDLGKVLTGNTPKTNEPENYGEYISFVKPGDFNSDGTIDFEKQKLSQIGMSKSRVIKENSALMVCIGATIGKCGFSEIDIVTNQQINSVTPTADFDHKFIYLQMLTNDFQRKVIDGSGQATLPIINKSKWESLLMKIPPLKIQLDIVERLDSLRFDTDNLKNSQLKKIQQLLSLKKSILKQAFSGELVKE